MKIKLSEIKIKNSFENTSPSEYKLSKCREDYKNGIINKHIAINHKNELMDGYILYLVLKENNVEETSVRPWRGKEQKRRQVRKSYIHKDTNKSKSYWDMHTTYVWGKHKPNSSREFVWRLSRGNALTDDNINIGDKVAVSTRYGARCVTVTRVEIMNSRPVDIPIKKCWARWENNIKK